ncbi:hypothetical protein CVT25_009211 [Psilocybe cyanescens]|uniref:DUF6697 domain-containing protein n=1 Tax=Psilocybe cyanescens TaxID=93625 RepID=A0A409WWK0_PSICY|nr:hypothetical protein CVT25_009211 [Psilocybe cyanescens]
MAELDAKQCQATAEDASSASNFDEEALNHKRNEIRVDVFDGKGKSSLQAAASTQCPGSEVAVNGAHYQGNPELEPVKHIGMNLEDSSDEEDPNTYGEIAIHPLKQATFAPTPAVNSAELNVNFQHSTNEQNNKLVRTVRSSEGGTQDQATRTFVKTGPHEDESFKQASLSRQRKRPRLVPQVVVPTWAALQQRRKEDFEKIKKMNNPKFKKTKDMEFSLSAIYDRLKGIGLDPYEVTLDSEIRDKSVSRLFMSSLYGGGPQLSFPEISPQKLAQHGIKHFMYVNVENHSHAPQYVGNPGFFFDSEPADNWESLFYVFVRLKPTEWLYVGIYVLIPSPPLSKGEWRSMTERVRGTWVNLIYKKRWGTGFRLRVAARRELGHKPTEADLDQFWKDGKHHNVTPEDIRSALDSGTEVAILIILAADRVLLTCYQLQALGAFMMKCVGYDENFQRELVAKFPHWTPPSAKPKGKGKKLNAQLKQSQASKGKRKREETPESEPLEPESEEDVNLNEHEDDEHSTSSTRKGQRLQSTPTREVDIIELSDSDEVDVDLTQAVSIRYREKGTRKDPIVL